MTTKGFARTNFRKIDNKIKHPRAATSSYEPGKLPAACGMPVGLQVGSTVIVCYELGGKFYPNDAALWAEKMSATLGVTVPPPNIKTHLLPGADDSAGDADGEVALDWQKEAEFWYYMTGTVPNILLVYGPNSGQAFVDCVNYTNSLTTADLQKLFGVTVALLIGAGSWSWGQEEDQWAASDLAALLTAVTAAKYPVTAASGDNTADDGANQPTVDAPSCLPVIVGAGGTSRPPGGSEVVWNNGGGEGTGGGFSKVYPTPTWQPANSQGTGRMVPDMAMDADPNTGHDVIVNGQWQVIGGTSAVAPMMAGILAVINGVRAFGGLAPITGSGVNPLLWSSPSCFFDITNGNNWSSGNGTGYVATVGPDPCTGLGRPLATLISALSGGTNPTPVPPSPPPSSHMTYGFTPLFGSVYEITPLMGSPALPRRQFIGMIAVSGSHSAARMNLTFGELVDILKALDKYLPAVLPIVNGLIESSNLTPTEKQLIESILTTLVSAAN